MNTQQQLRTLVDARRGLIVPGAFKALLARVIVDLGFQAIDVTGAGVSNMSFALPDQAFMGLSDIAGHTARPGYVVEVPLRVDADTGFGNALNTHQTVHTLGGSGWSANQDGTR